MLEQHRTLREGVVAGALAATAVAIWFLVLDTVAGRPFATPAMLGASLSSLFAVPAASTTATTASVLGYTAFHYAAFAVAGLIGATVMNNAEEEPSVLIGFFILVRATFPRLRYDMLMKFGWKGMLPTALMNIVLIALSLALQQQLGLAGHLLAVLAGVALCLVLLAGKYAGYRKQRRGTADDDTVPIRRPSVLASSAGAGAPTGTAAAALPPPVAPAAAPAAAPGKAS